MNSSLTNIHNILVLPEFIKARFKFINGITQHNTVKQTIPDARPEAFHLTPNMSFRDVVFSSV